MAKQLKANNNNNSAPGAPPRPSDARRQQLASEISLPEVSNFFPIERYYEAAQTLYDSVLQTSNHDDRQYLDLCYVYSRRYCMFVLEAIPTHNYHDSPKYKSLKNQHLRQVQTVIDLLEHVALRMDEDCLEQERQAKLRAEQERLNRERQQQYQLAQWQQRIQEQKKKKPTLDGADVQQSALEKLKLLNGSHTEIAMGIPLEVPPSRKRSSTRYGLSDSDTDEELSRPLSSIVPYGVPLPPPLLPPRSDNLSVEEDKKEDDLAPPSYQAVVRMHQYHPFFGPAQQAITNDSIPVRPLGPPDVGTLVQPKLQPMRQLQQIYLNMYQKYQQDGRIQVLPLQTYQGRVSASTNGCTVISALMAARHLNSSTLSSISDASITSVIDQQCVPFLRDIRRKLGLGEHALIIPSDVHDHLVDAKILHQDYFSGAAGGNIMDPNHSGEFLSLLTESTKPDSNGKAAATLFFREHVISIVKFPGDNNTSNSNGASQRQHHFDLIDSLPSVNGRASRTRCVDADALQVLLQWYAARKFSDANCTYIDRNPVWDDRMADLDPRVFQGFVWST